ncbi:hypothetical protein C7120_08940 [Prevotella sp. oral taxon 376]|nr:hypothetical protein C7120_08940 [Prevotella sp. oral taxon 376]
MRRVKTMNKDNGYWVKVLDEEKANILISLGYSCCSDVAIIKVADDTCREGFAYWVEDYMVKLNKSYLRPLSYLDALNLDMGYNDKWREICTDCLARECFDREEAYNYLCAIDLGKGKDFSTNTRDMNIFNSVLRKELEDLHQFADKAKSFKFEPRKVSHEPQLPDEIDLYNFFEKYKGVAKGVTDDKLYAKLCGYHAYYMIKSFETGSLSKYLSIYEDIVKADYYIGNNRYHAIKFKDRGVFLVSEKRYKELKARKGCTV